MMMKISSRSVLWSMFRHEGLFLCFVETLELVVSRVPSGSTAAACSSLIVSFIEPRKRIVLTRTVVQEEEHSSDHRNKVQRQCDSIAENAIERKALKGTHERFAEILAVRALSKTFAALLDQLTLAMSTKGGIEHLGESRSEEQLTCKEREEEDAFGEHEEEGDDGCERSRDESKDGHLGEEGEESHCYKDGCGEAECLQQSTSHSEEHIRVCE
jgi:hypothetical protein